MESYPSLYTSDMSHIVVSHIRTESYTDGVIIDSAARMSQYVRESCFKYRSYGKNRIDRYRRWKHNSRCIIIFL